MPLSARRIGVMSLPLLLALGALVVVPGVRDRLAARKAAAEAAQRKARDLFAVGLQPCSEDWGPPRSGALAISSDELAMDVFPSFIAPYGLRLSDRGLRAYEGDSSLYIPPPLPRPGEPDRMRTLPRLDVTSTLPLPASTTAGIADVFRQAIGSATESDRLGADGATYFFGIGTACARTWSPELDTRAGRLTQLADDLVGLARAGAGGDALVRARVERSIAELRRDALRFESTATPRSNGSPP